MAGGRKKNIFLIMNIKMPSPTTNNSRRTSHDSPVPSMNMCGSKVQNGEELFNLIDGRSPEVLSKTSMPSPKKYRLALLRAGP